MSAPFMQLYIADYLGDTRHLTTEQHGAYLLLLMTMWRADGRLPNDDKKLARIAGSTASRWAKIKDDVLAFFEVEGDELTNRRLSLELKKATEKSIKRAEVGTRGGLAKSLKNKETSVANARRLPEHSSDIRCQSSSEDKSSDAVRVVVDHDKAAWDQAVDVLTRQGGLSEKQARAAFGRILASNGLRAKDMLPSVASASVSETQDPLAYLTRSAQAIARRGNEAAKPKRVAWV